MELRGDKVVLRAVLDGDVDALRAMRETVEVREWWGPLEDDFPFGDDPEATRFTIVVEGVPAGLIQYGEEEEPNYRHAWIDIFVDPRAPPAGHLPRRDRDAAAPPDRGSRPPPGDHRSDGRERRRACVLRAGGLPARGGDAAAERDWRTGEWRDAILMEFVLPAEP